MTIAEAISGLMELARRSGLTFEELLDWIARNDRAEVRPWEEVEDDAS